MRALLPLLGERQLKFLRQWAMDWQDCDMKAVLSQTIFAGGAHLYGQRDNRLYCGLDSNGWPRTIDQLDNYARKPVAYLPALRVTGMTDPVVQVTDEATDDVVCTLRIRGTEFRPMAFKTGRYTVRVGEPGTDRVKTLADVESRGLQEVGTTEVAL